MRSIWGKKRQENKSTYVLDLVGDGRDGVCNDRDEKGGTQAGQRQGGAEWGQSHHYWGNGWWPPREGGGVGGVQAGGGALIINMVEALMCASRGGGETSGLTRNSRYPPLIGVQGWTVRSRTGAKAIDRIRVLSSSR